MLSLSQRTPQGRIEAFYGIKIFDSVQKLSHFRVLNFERIPYDKKVENLNFLVFQINWN